MATLRGLVLLCCALGAVSGAPAAEPTPRGRLLRVPKVYNALITSNEPLLPSRTEQATVGQVLYYPPHHATYPASSGPLILPQVSAQAPPLYDPSQPGGALPQPLESLPPPGSAANAPPAPPAPPLELSLQPNPHGPQGGPEQQQAAPWPVVYASDVQQQYADHQHQEQHQEQPEHAVDIPEELPPPSFPAARAVQTVERVDQPGQYQPPPAVDIDSIKNNRPSEQGIPDVPPPPLPVGRGRKAQHQQPPPPGLLPF